MNIFENKTFSSEGVRGVGSIFDNVGRNKQMERANALKARRESMKLVLPKMVGDNFNFIHSLVFEKSKDTKKRNKSERALIKFITGSGLLACLSDNVTLTKEMTYRLVKTFEAFDRSDLLANTSFEDITTPEFKIIANMYQALKVISDKVTDNDLRYCVVDIAGKLGLRIYALYIDDRIKL